MKDNNIFKLIEGEHRRSDIQYLISCFLNELVLEKNRALLRNKVYGGDFAFIDKELELLRDKKENFKEFLSSKCFAENNANLQITVSITIH
jgi:hypothetical protein